MTVCVQRRMGCLCGEEVASGGFIDRPPLSSASFAKPFPVSSNAVGIFPAAL
jgi:hypothetical protein